MRTATLMKLLGAPENFNPKEFSLDEELPVIPILSYIAMDIAYQNFESLIKPIECRQEAKRLKNEWGKVMNAMYTKFFLNLTPDECEEVTDLMDDLSEHLTNDMAILRVAVHGEMQDIEDMELKKILANVYVVLNFVALSHLTHEKLYHKVPYDYQKVFNLAIRWASAFARSRGRMLSIELGKNVDDLRRNMLQKTIRWGENTLTTIN